MKQIYILSASIVFIFSALLLDAQAIWTGPDFTFSKEDNADWTLPANQDMITANVILTRQNKITLYNYQHWQSTFNTDAAPGDLCRDFWNVECSNDESVQTFTPTGGTKGLKWAILDDTGSTTNWSGFNFYGTLGDPSNFYSFHNVISMINSLEDNLPVNSVDDNFNINGGIDDASMNDWVGKKLGVWLVDDNIYFTLTFNIWGSGGSGGAISYTRSTDEAVSTNDIELNENIKLFPNPTKDFIEISGLAKAENYSIYTTLGTEIAQGNVFNNEKINLENLDSGLYFLKFENGDTFKFIRE